MVCRWSCNTVGVEDRRRRIVLRWMLGVSIGLVLAGLVGMLIFGPRVGLWGPTATGVLLSIAFGSALRSLRERRHDGDSGAP